MRKNLILFLITILNLFFLSFSLLQCEEENQNISPEEEIIKTSLENLRKQKSLRFSILLESRIGNQIITFSKLEGEGIPPDKSRVKGEVNIGKIQMYVDCIIIGNTQYDRDKITGDWYRKERTQKNKESIEKDPFEIIKKAKKAGKFKYIGLKKHRDIDVDVYEFIPKVRDDFVKPETTGIILIEREKNIFRKFYLKQSALRKDGLIASSLIEIEFYDFDKDIKIEPPEVYF
jgi:hypothetical protein